MLMKYTDTSIFKMYNIYIYVKNKLNNFHMLCIIRENSYTKKVVGQDKD